LPIPSARLRCWCAAVNLFSEIEKRHGKALALRVFAQLGAPTGAQRKRLQDACLYTFFEVTQRQGWTIQATARRIAELNKTWPPELRLGRSGSTSEDALRQQLGRIVKRRGRARPSNP
jgi:hypothetical protein